MLRGCLPNVGHNVFDADFYCAFEDYYRGSQGLIKSRLAVYLPFIQPIKKFYVNCPSIDLGCGRGEWLELMQENEIHSHGVDIDQSMLDKARERGLKVHLGDAIQHLTSLASDSQMLVSGFHLVEHLHYKSIQALIKESYRVLKPGGLLILETPNAENVTVGTEKFYLDPTHLKPIPSQFLSFVCKYEGYERVKVLRLQEPAELAKKASLALLSVFNGVSPDYAVVAQKGGASEVVLATTSAFDAEYGLSLENLANKYDRQIKTLIRQVEARVQQSEITLLTMQNSLLWRLTPSRMVSRAKKIPFHLHYTAKSKLKNKILLLIIRLKGYINQRPRLRSIALTILARFRAFQRRLKQATRNTAYLENMSPSARSIYGGIKTAIKKNSMKKSK